MRIQEPRQGHQEREQLFRDRKARPEKGLGAGRSPFSDRDLRHWNCAGGRCSRETSREVRALLKAAERLLPLPTLQENRVKPSHPLERQRGAKTT